MNQSKNYVIVSNDPYNKPPGVGVSWNPKHRAWIKAQQQQPGPAKKKSFISFSKPKSRSRKKKKNVLDSITKIAFIILVIVIMMIAFKEYW